VDRTYCSRRTADQVWQWDSFLELTAIQELAERAGLSFYDGAYLMLAIAEQGKLATLDEKLRDAAKGQGIEVFE
jgi:predicted nucleic acid-binding protein